MNPKIAALLQNQHCLTHLCNGPCSYLSIGRTTESREILMSSS